MKQMNVKKLMLRIIKVSVCFIIYFLLIYGILYAISSFIHPDKELNILGFEVLVAECYNSEPRIDQGDLIIVKRCKEQDVKIGELIVFKKADILITHNVESKNEAKFKTKGIDNEQVDAWELQIHEIEGKYLFRIAKIGFLIKMMQNKLFLIFIIFMIYVCKKYKKNLKRSNDNLVRTQGKRYNSNKNKGKRFK